MTIALTLLQFEGSPNNLGLPITLVFVLEMSSSKVPQTIDLSVAHEDEPESITVLSPQTKFNNFDYSHAR